MGVVRREGDWRLEKLEEGHYEISYQRDPQAKVITPEYEAGMMDDATLSALPVHEVGSYSEAEGIFEEHTYGGSPAGFAAPNSSSSADEFNLGFDSATAEEGSDEDMNLPPGGLALALLFAGGVVVYGTGLSFDSPSFMIGSGLGLIGLAILAWAVVLYQKRGPEEAIDFLMTTDEGDKSPSSSSAGNDEVETTPPAPEKLKNRLIFERAEQQCEWCEKHLDNPEVHHIEPRSEGGPNEPENLIVLCPNCHRKADGGGISRTKLEAKVEHIMDD